MRSIDVEMSDSVFAAHLVAQIHANVSVLASQGKISHADAAAIKARLPPTSASEPVTAPRASVFPVQSSAPVQDSPLELPVSHPSPVVHPPQPHHSPAIPENAPNSRSTPSSLKRARALWTYSGSAPDDLSFSKGDTIVILAEENADWWKGEVLGSQGRSGLFPSNHVEIIASSPEPSSHSNRGSTGAGTYPGPTPAGGGYNSPAPAGATYSNTPPTHDHYQAPYNTHTPSQYPPPPPGQIPSYGNPPPQPYMQQPPPNNQWQAPTYAYNQADYKQPPPLEHSQSAPPTQQINVEKPKKKPFQGRFGQALVGGAGFGAGSAVASNLVNAIL